MARNAVLGRAVGSGVALALGIDPEVTRVREITIGFAATDAVVAYVEVIPTEDQLAAMGFKFPNGEGVSSGDD